MRGSVAAEQIRPRQPEARDHVFAVEDVVAALPRFDDPYQPGTAGRPGDLAGSCSRPGLIA